MTGTMLLEGSIAIRAALESHSRPIHRLYVQADRLRQFAHLLALARAAGIVITPLPRAELDRMATGHTHGGIIAEVGARRYVPLDALTRDINLPFIAMLDGIEDPYNFGQVIRALYAAGAHGLVVRARSWLSAAAIVSRSSAGASEKMLIAQVDAPQDAIRHFRQCGIRIVCAANHGRARALHQAELRQPLAVFVGGEKRGMAKRILKEADIILRIPYARQFGHSLGVTAAASVIAFEVARQRNAK